MERTVGGERSLAAIGNGRRARDENDRAEPELDAATTRRAYEADTFGSESPGAGRRRPMPPSKPEEAPAESLAPPPGTIVVVLCRRGRFCNNF